MKLPTEKLRQVIRLIHDDSHSNRVIGMTVGVSPNTVKNVRDLLRYNHKNWDDLKELDNETLDKILWGETKKPAIRKPQPDWSLVHEELKKRDVTLELLWDEYRSAVPDGVSYAQFTRNYRTWQKRCKLSLRFVYQPGEMLFVDFCGKTMPNSVSSPRIRLMQAVRSSLSPSRRRCTHSMPCCVSVLGGTKCICGRDAASHTAAASFMSFLPVLPWTR